MKLQQLIVCIIPVALAVAGCDIQQVRTAKTYGMVDLTPGASDKGYVEFYTEKSGAAVPIFLVDARGRARVLGAVGLHEGDSYSRLRYDADVAEKLRVAVPPGNPTFILERDGERVKVPVVSGQVTPVEIHYVRLEHGEQFDLYRVDSDILPSHPMTEEPKDDKAGKKK